jgi:hypothetical protein
MLGVVAVLLPLVLGAPAVSDHLGGTALLDVFEDGKKLAGFELWDVRCQKLRTSRWSCHLQSAMFVPTKDSTTMVVLEDPTDFEDVKEREPGVFRLQTKGGNPCGPMEVVLTVDATLSFLLADVHGKMAVGTDCTSTRTYVSDRKSAGRQVLPIQNGLAVGGPR